MMTAASLDRAPAVLPGSTSLQPVVFARPGLAGELAIPDGSTTLALFAHPTAAGRLHPGHRFIGDVLRANGVAMLSIGLRTADEEACHAPIAGAAEVTQRLHAVLNSLAAHAATRHLPLALIGVNEAAAACAFAARQPGFEAIRSLVLLDGRVELHDAEVAVWRQPTLCIAGRHGITLSGQPLAGARSLPPPHRLIKLRTQTQPLASAGAFETMACEIAAWLQPHRTPRREAPVHVMEIASAQ